MMVSGPDAVELGRRLCDLRASAGFSTAALARRLGWSQSKVSKTERAKSLPTIGDIQEWARATNATEQQRRELAELAERAANDSQQRRRVLTTGRKRLQENIQRLEESATMVRVFSPDVIAGLLQTRPYAAAMFRLGWGGPEESNDDILDARIDRQTVLDGTARQIQIVLGEAALRRMVITPAEMREQLLALQSAARRPNISISVIRFSDPESVHQYNAFAVIGDPHDDDESCVLIETLTRALTIHNRKEVEEYVRYFDVLAQTGVSGDLLDELIQDCLTNLP